MSNIFWIRRPAQQQAANQPSFFSNLWAGMTRPLRVKSLASVPVAATTVTTTQNSGKPNTTQVIILVCGSLAILLIVLLTMWGTSHLVDMEKMQTTPDGRARAIAEAEAVAIRSRAIDPSSCIEAAKAGLILTGCGISSSPALTTAQQQPSPTIQVTAATKVTCPVVGTARRGDVTFNIYGSQAGCETVMSGTEQSVSLHTGTFIARKAMTVRQKDCASWADTSQDVTLPEGGRLSGCFRITGPVNLKAV